MRQVFRDRFSWRTALIASAITLPFAVAAQATDRLVGGTGALDTLPASQGGGPNPCTTIPCSLRHAIQQAFVGDTVRILAGPIQEHDLIVNKTITIAGCPGRIRIEAAGQGRHFDIATSWPATVTLNCLILAGGAADEGGAIRVGAEGEVILFDSRIARAEARRGGAIFSEGGTITVRQSELALNTADAEGGAIFSAAGDVTVRQSEVAGNSAGDDGGAVAALDGTVVITRSDLMDNTAEGDGGALHVTRATLRIRNDTVFRNNRAPGQDGGAVFGTFATMDIEDGTMLAENAARRGGAVYTSSGTLTIKDSTLEQNQATLSGGAVGTSQTDATIAASDLTHNTAERDGGAILREDGGALTLREVEFEGNSAGADGGALADLPGAVSQATTVRRALFVDNTASGNGGAIFRSATGGQLRAVNTTFSGNEAAIDGGAVFNGPGSEINVVYSTFVGNRADPGNNLAGGGFTSLGAAIASRVVMTSNLPLDCSSTPFAMTGRDNLVDSCNVDFELPGATFNRGSVTNLDPDLRPNRGSTATHALLTGSNAIDLGPLACVDERAGVDVPLDQRGEARPFDGNQDGVARCDIGAFELHPLTSQPKDLDLDDLTRLN